jgi:hypothetical protein
MLGLFAEIFSMNPQRRDMLICVGADSCPPLQNGLQKSPCVKNVITLFHQSATFFIQQLSKLSLLKGDVQ